MHRSWGVTSWGVGADCAADVIKLSPGDTTEKDLPVFVGAKISQFLPTAYLAGSPRIAPAQSEALATLGRQGQNYEEAEQCHCPKTRIIRCSSC